MTRRRSTLILTTAAALLAGGCTTFSDAASIARVNDAELDQDQFDEMLPLVADPATLEPGATGGAARTTISVWLEAQVFTQALDDAGIEIPQDVLDITTANLSDQFPTFTSVSDETRDLLVAYVAGFDLLTQLPSPPEDEVAAWFDAGPSSSGLACVAHILVETEGEAADVVDELAEAEEEGGDAAEQAAFIDLAAERSIDPSAADNGGFLSCDRADAISQQYVPPFADAALAATPGVPTDPVESDFGFHVIRLQTYAESTEQLAPLTDAGLIQVEFAVDAADIRVDSRYGTAEGLTVVPLGG